jgi:hypothetical protein
MMHHVGRRFGLIAGREFGSRQGQVVRVVRAHLYGLNSSDASLRNMLQESIINEMEFMPTIANPDVYRRRLMKPDGLEYWELLLVYVDDILIISHEPNVHLNKLKNFFPLCSAGSPEHYLCANISKVHIPGDDRGQEFWAKSARTYVCNAVETIKKLLQEDGGLGLKNLAKTPLPSGYCPELDVTDELKGEMVSRYSQLICILRWMLAEIGRIDIYYEVSILSQYLALPRVGHLEAVYHVFSYLNKHAQEIMYHF